LLPKLLFFFRLLTKHSIFQTRLGSIQLVSFDTDASADMLSYQFETDEPYIEFLPKLRMKPTLVKGINISQAGIAWYAIFLVCLVFFFLFVCPRAYLEGGHFAWN
jgi:hypothetical protein